MKVIVALIIACIVVFSAKSLFTEDPAPAIEIKTLALPSGVYRYVDQEILIQLNQGVSISELEELLSSFGAYIKDTDCHYKYGFVVAIVPKSLDLLQIRNNLKNNSLIKSASLDYVGEVFTDDEFFNDQWALRKIFAEKGWNKFTKGNSSVVVAILDSGCHPPGYSIHEDVDANRLILGEDFTGTNTFDDSLNHGLAMLVPAG